MEDNLKQFEPTECNSIFFEGRLYNLEHSSIIREAYSKLGFKPKECIEIVHFALHFHPVHTLVGALIIADSCKRQHMQPMEYMNNMLYNFLRCVSSKNS